MQEFCFTSRQIAVSGFFEAERSVSGFIAVHQRETARPIIQLQAMITIEKIISYNNYYIGIFFHRRLRKPATRGHKAKSDTVVAHGVSHHELTRKEPKTGLSALALKRHLGVSYPTAWLLHQKINRAMAKQDSTHRLDGTVQLDDAYLGGERAGGKPGRGSENKVPFVAAVSLNEAGHPMHIKLNLVSGFTSTAIGNWAKASLEPGTLVVSDGLGCFAAVTDAGCSHMPLVVGALKPRDLPQFKWVNTVLGNLKTTLAGAFHSLKYNKYASHYLAAFAYRFNRRFDLRTLIARLIVDVSRCGPIPEKLVRAQAEAHF